MPDPTSDVSFSEGDISTVDSLTAQQIVAEHKVKTAVRFLLTVCLILILVDLWQGWASRQYRLQDKEVAMANLAQTLSSQAHDSIKQADTVLFSLVDRIETEGMDADQLHLLKRLLSAQRNELSQLHGLFIYDQDGAWIVASNGILPPNANNSDSEYFIYHRDRPDRGPHVGPSIKSRSTGEWVLPVSRRINNPDGSFAGVALATIYLDHFLKLYNSIDIGNNGVINLISSEAKIVLRRPFNEAVIGTNVAEGPLFTQLLPKGPFGTATVTSYLDGVERVVGYRRVNDYPLIVFSAVNKEEVLASWRQETAMSTAIVFLLMTVLGGIGYRFIRLMKKQGRIQNELLGAQDKLMEVNRTLELLALEDALTGLANRRQFDLFTQTEMGRAKRGQRTLALLMIDVDHFKRFNDRYGHLVGDECLRRISAIIRENIRRPGDLAARFGGEEFAVVLPATDYVGAFIVAEKIRKAVLRAEIEHKDSGIGLVTVSIGVGACSPSVEDTLDGLIGAADEALYVAKTSGRNMSVIAN
ncbi:sensor domain-containing diguanylate cyclase [Pseudomonas protegens]|uniref:sensor domain-containing diguanylate cyclase n=1 Tax=Pseudomonas protegens TaxID=380021 RepID=UPI000AB265DF|nr:sensor domain-containing diguanylate cyclase [Pseudomonas protegens]